MYKIFSFGVFHGKSIKDYSYQYTLLAYKTPFEGLTSVLIQYFIFNYFLCNLLRMVGNSHQVRLFSEILNRVSQSVPLYQPSSIAEGAEKTTRASNPVCLSKSVLYTHIAVELLTFLPYAKPVLILLINKSLYVIYLFAYPVHSQPCVTLLPPFYRLGNHNSEMLVTTPVYSTRNT